MRVKLEIASLRADLAERRERDREELRNWINGSFLRSAVAEAQLQALGERLKAVEDSIA